MMNNIIRENAVAAVYRGVSSNYRVHENAYKPYIAKAQNSAAYYYGQPVQSVTDRTRSIEYRKRVRKSARFAKVCVTLTMVLMLAAAFVAGGFVFGQDSAGMDTPVLETVRVMSGDTLWDIAAEYAPEHTDIRTYISEIRKANNLSDSMIQAGMVLYVPV
jgi:hypothetical protein